MNDTTVFDRQTSPPRLVTVTLIALCLAIFAYCFYRNQWQAQINSELLLSMGALFGPLVQADQPWRLFSAIFLHGSLLHVGMNMLALWQIGLFMERLFGRWRFLALYLVCGLLGGLASVWWKPEGLSVGASGAIFGLYGALLSWLLVHRQAIPHEEFQSLKGATVGFVGYSLVMGFIIPGIDNAAHLGGLLAGILLGAAWGPCWLSPQASQPFSAFLAKHRQLLALGASLLCLVSAAGLWQTAPQVAVTWQHHVKFAELARRLGLQDAELAHTMQRLTEALQQGRLNPRAAAQELEENAIPHWQQLITEFASENLAPRDKAKHQALLRYAELRLQVVQYYARGLSSGQAAWFAQAQLRQQAAEQTWLNLRAQGRGGAEANEED